MRPYSCARAPVIRALVLGATLLMLASACGTSSGAGTSRYDVEWFETREAAPVTRDAVRGLLSRPWLDAIEVRHGAADGDGVTSTLESCRDYLDVAGLRVRPTVGGTTALIFQARALGCQTKALILTAQPAAVSYLRPLAFDEDLPDRLPWQVAMILSGAEAQRIADGRPEATWRQALFGPLTEFSSCGTHCGRYGNPGADQTVRLVARGDFDGDGIEDVLLSSSDVVRGGSYQAARMFLLTRRQPGGRIELLRELDY